MIEAIKEIFMMLGMCVVGLAVYTLLHTIIRKFNRWCKNGCKNEWKKKYLKEAWACDSGAKALEKQISCKPEEYVPDFPYNIFSTQKCTKCGTPVIGKKISKYCSECGQKIDWGEE